MNIGKRSDSNRDPRINLRPIIASGSAGSLIQLYTYKTETGGDATNGWAKTYVTQTLDPPVFGDISKSIATRKWELGKNLFVPSWYINVSWGTANFGSSSGGQGNITTTDSTVVTTLVKALGPTEGELGTIYSSSEGCNDSQEVTIVDLLFTNMKWSFDATWAGSGSYSGPANAFLIHTTRSSTVTTDGFPPLVGANYALASSYLNIGPVKK